MRILALLFVFFLLAGCSASDETSGPSTSSPDISESSEETDGISNEMEEGTEQVTASEEVHRDIEPVLMTGSNLNILLSQYEHNLNCLMNAAVDVQPECRRHLTGDRTGPGNTLTVALDDLIHEVQQYRQTVDPDYVVEVENIEILDSLLEPDRDFLAQQFQVEAIVRESYTDGRSAVWRLMFSKGYFDVTTSAAEELEVTTESTYLWLLKGRSRTEDVYEERFHG